MPTLFGMPAVEVEQPDGEIVKYLIVAIPAVQDAWRSWKVTSPKADGKSGTYVVSEYPSGRWGCDCPAHTLGKNRGGRWHKVKQNPVCKHARAVWDEIGCDHGSHEAADSGRPGTGSPGTVGGGVLPPDERTHPAAADPPGQVPAPA